jgi:hypothetical protein
MAAFPSQRDGRMILLTQPKRRWRARRIVSYVGNQIKSRPQQDGPRGPAVVVASLLRGLESLGCPFQLNPRSWPDEGVVGVLSDLDALSEAMEWRRGGRHRRVVAGPFLVTLPSDAPRLMSSPDIDLCLVPSRWVAEAYAQDTPALEDRLAVWPAGVDPEYWSPASPGAKRGGCAVVFVKRQPAQENVSDAELGRAIDVLNDANLDVELLVYGHFDHDGYRAKLRAADLLVFFSPTESQGLALAEAWACDVPTLVWEKGVMHYKQRRYRSSSAPLLSERTGARFADSAALRELLNRWDQLCARFEPRAWVLEHLTDAACARNYLKLAQSTLDGSTSSIDV